MNDFIPQDPVFRRAVELLDAGDAVGLREYLKLHPGIVRERVTFAGAGYFENPALLEFAAENPIRHGDLPGNIVEVCRVILEAGAEQAAVEGTLGLVCSGCVVRECGVQGELITLLCDAGAEPGTAMLAALGHGEFGAVEALIARGAPVDLPVAAAMGRAEIAAELLGDADATARHLALALASQFGHAPIVQTLLDAGEDPNRYNPAGAHAHSTPLHQAALAGHLDVVRLLAERGARLDMRDTIYEGTPAGWAEHGGRAEVVEYLKWRSSCM